MGWVKNGITLLISCLFTLLIVELGLRFMPVMEVSRVKPLFSNSQPFDVSTVANAKLMHSSEWNFENALERQTNNAGFFSDYDYEPGHEGVFVIGDSFVEARQVRFEETFHQLIAKQLGEPVYNIGLSGAPLSQYHAYAKQVCSDYKPTAMVISIIGNDFDESLYDQRARSGFFHYDSSGALVPTTYEISTLRQWANRSSLIRYMYFNLNVGGLLQSARQAEPTSQESKLELVTYPQLTELFLRELSSLCVPASAITFVLDANRYETPESSIYTENPVRLNKMVDFKVKAEEQGFRVVDMQDVMLAHYRTNNRVFEYSYDYHWNTLGHAVVAETVLNALQVSE